MLAVIYYLTLTVCLSVWPLRPNLIRLIINVYRKRPKRSSSWTSRLPLCSFLKLSLSFCVYKIINSRAGWHLEVRQLHLSGCWEIKAQRGWAEMSLSPSSSIPTTFSEASWEESIGGSQAGYLSNPLPQTERDTPLPTPCSFVTVGFNGSTWLVLNKMAHVAELALVWGISKKEAGASLIITRSYPWRARTRGQFRTTVLMAG